MLKKVGRFLSARVQGTKGVRKYDDWMKRNKWASGLLGAGDLALAFYGPGLLGRGLSKVGQMAGTGSRIGRAATSASKFIAGAPEVAATGTTGSTPAIPNIYGRIAGGAQKYGSKLANYALDPKNALVTGQALMAASNMYGNAQQQNLANRQMRMNMDDAERQRREAAAAAEMLRPLFTSMFGGGR